MMYFYTDKVLKMEAEELVKLARVTAQWDGFTKKCHAKKDFWENDWNVEAVVKCAKVLRDHCNQIIARFDWLDTYEVDMNSL